VENEIKTITNKRIVVEIFGESKWSLVSIQDLNGKSYDCMSICLDGNQRIKLIKILQGE
jgi:hypothetical protein